MPAELTTGIFTVFGAAMGSLGTMGANWINTMAQRRQNTDKRNERALEARRSAYRDFLACIDQTFDLARHLALELKDKTSIDDCIKIHDRYIEEWRALMPTMAGIELEGPEEVAHAARAVGAQALPEVVEVVDNWWAAVMKLGPQNVNSRWNRFEGASESFWGKHRSFIEVARRHLSD